MLSESLLSCMAAVAMTTGLTNFRSSCFLASHLLPPPPLSLCWSLPRSALARDRAGFLKETEVKPAEQIS